MILTVAIDGPAAAGKGTIARALASRFGLVHLDTGLLYRAVGLRHLAGETPEAAARGLLPEDLERGDELRDPEVSQAASRVAAILEVREALFDFQRRFARREGGAVMDGRDIGTVICPEAEVKLYVVADDEIRARRRFEELSARGVEASLEDIAAQLRVRDRQDAERAQAPLVKAPGAVELDTTRLTIEEAVARASAEVERAIGAA